MLLDHLCDGPAAIRTHIGAIFVSLELSRSTWLVTSLSPGKGEKMSRHSVPAGDTAELMKLFAERKRKAAVQIGQSCPVITIQEAGLDGFWLHRVLQQEGIESHVVDPASIATPRRRRRAKTDKLDGETLLRALLAYKRGEPRVCAMPMDCMASNAATKNGLVLSSLPAASGIVVQSPRATTECEFDLASKPDCQTGSNLGSQIRGVRMP